MAEIVGVKVELNAGEAIKNAGSLRQQLRAAVVDLQNMQEEFGDISPEAQAAARSVAGLRDAINDANEVAELFSPEKKFQAFVNVAQGVASGFAAAQGAMALFGAQSEEVEKTLLKVQAAMSLAQGLAGLKAATEDFTRLAGVIKNTAAVQGIYNFVMKGTIVATEGATVATTAYTVALRVMRAALVATGIGAIVVLLGTLVAQLMKATEATDDFAEALAKADKETQDFANSTSDAIVAAYQKQSEIAVARAQAEGKSSEEIYKIQKKYLDMIARERHANVENQKNDNLDAGEANKKAAEADTAVQLAELNKQAKDRQEADQKRKEAQEKANQEALERQRKFDEKVKKFDEEKDKFGQQFVEAAKERGEQERKQREERQQAEDEANRKRIDDAIAAQDAQLARDKEQSDARKAIDKAELDHKYAMANAAAQILGGLASLAGEQTAAGKALAVTGAVIATYASAQQAYWAAFNPVPTYLSPVLGAAYAAAAVVTGIANVKKILSVQVPGHAGGGGAPSISANAPLVPQQPVTPTTRLDQQTINDIGNAVPVRAYVVESDITASQDRINRIQNAAKFR